MAESSFGDLLRHYRLAAGLTQQELAERAGLSTRGISDLERGARALPRKDTLRRLLQALDPPPPERAALIAAAQRPPRTSPRGDGMVGSVALPITLTPLIGREAEIAAVAALLEQPAVRLLTLTGPGGTGKTRLALAVAERALPDFPDGVVFVPLASLGNSTFVASAIAQRLGVREGAGQSLLDRLTARLSDQRLLLVLDSFEHLLPAAPLVADLLSTCPEFQVLATSRAPLHLSGEHIFPVPPLKLPASGRLPPLDALMQYEAVRLFVARVQAVKPGFTLTEENAPAVAEIVRRLDGLPLALELAAARAPVLSPTALLARLDHRLPLLTGGAQDLPDRQRTLRATIAWSYDLLPPHEQALFRRLAVFAGGCTLEAAAAVAKAADEPGMDLIEGLAALLDNSLLREESGPNGESRYLMLETIREFGLEQLWDTTEADAVVHLHVGHVVAFAEAVAAPILDGLDPASAFARVDLEQGNLRAALTWSVEHGAVPVLLRLVTALRTYWTMLGRLNEGRAWTERAVHVSEGAPPTQRTIAFWEAGWFARFLGNPQRAESLAQESLTLAGVVSNDLATAKALYLLGFVAEDRGELAQARALHEEALQLLLPMNAPYWTAHSLYHVGRLSCLCGDLDVAERHLEEALVRCRREGHRYGPALVQSGMAMLALKRGEPARAAALWQERLGLVWDAWGLRWCLEALAEIAVASGEHLRAARLLGAAEIVRERQGVARVPGLLSQYEQEVAVTKKALGESAFAAAWTEGRQLSPEAARAEAALVAREVSESSRPQAVSIRAGHELTPRELDVLRLVAVGRSNREIAETLFISVPTVKRHLSTILGKLQLPSRSAATAYAHTHDLV